MIRLAWAVMASTDEFWARVRAERFTARELWALVGFIAGACAVYGAVMAGWRSPRLSLYVAIKLPALFLFTVASVAVFNWMVASVLGAPVSSRQSLVLAAGAMTTAGWLLLALAPVSLFLVLTAVPQQGTNAELRYAHNVMLVTHIAALAGAGLAGNATLWKGLRALAPSRERAWAVFGTWLAAYAFVGCQVSWVLRPFVGSPFYPVVFLRPDALDRNFYEFVFGEVLPFIITGGARP
jgi:hypothetical protein